MNEHGTGVGGYPIEQPTPTAGKGAARSTGFKGLPCGEVRFLPDGRPCLVLVPCVELRELAEFVNRVDRAEAYAGRLPCPSAGPFVAAARRVLAISALVPLPEPQSAATSSSAARWVSTTRAAQLLNISDRAVRKRLKVGTLRGQQLGGRWLVDMKEIPDAAA